MKMQRLEGNVPGLILCNSHKHIYSMEMFFASLAYFHGLSIWADNESKFMIDALEIEDSNISKMLTNNAADAGLHILADEKFETNVSR